MKARPRVRPDGGERVSILLESGIVLGVSREQATELHAELGRALAGFENPKDVKPMDDADAFFAELEHIRGEVAATLEHEHRGVLPKILHGGRHSASCAAHMHDAIAEVGWEEVQAAVRWGLGQVAKGYRDARFQASLFRAEGSFPRLYDSFVRAKAAEGEAERAEAAAAAERAAKAVEKERADAAADIIAKEGAEALERFKKGLAS